MAVLTFKDGQFYYQVLSKYPSKPLSFKDAVDLRTHADAVAEKVFKRAFTKFYRVPTLPTLDFLDAHQKEGIKWILTRSRSYLAHAPGAGKTCQSIIASCFVQAKGPTLFIVPPTLTINWQREVFKFTKLLRYWPSVSVVPLSTGKNKMDWGADFIICPDSMLTKDWVYTALSKLKPKFIAVDEASRFKEPLSQRSKAFYGGKHKNTSYPGLFQDTRHVVFLDGSPMPNRPMELWAPVFSLNPRAIDCLGMYEYGFRFCGARQNHFGEWEFKGSTNEAELKQKLQRDFMHVVGEDQLKHPERLRSIVFMNQDVRSAEMKSWEKKHLSTINIKDEVSSQGEAAHHRKQIGLKKVKWVSQYVRDRLNDKGESVLLFAWHREVCEALKENLKEFKPVIVYGGISNDTREKAFRAFQDGSVKIIIGNIQALGRGHNLQKADRVIFAEYSWTSELNRQCEKRASRRGNNKSYVRCEYIVVPDSMDEIVLQSVFKKEKMVKQIVG